jgi:predicted alpha/beta-fold hydrolase
VCTQRDETQQQTLVAEDRTPVCLILHGMTGGSHVNYIRNFVQEVHRQGWHAAVVNSRGCGGSSLTSPVTFSGANSQDLRAVIAHVRAQRPHAPVLCVGFSLGGSVLLKYLSEEQDESPVVAAAALCTSFDMLVSGEHLSDNNPWSVFGCVPAQPTSQRPVGARYNYVFTKKVLRYLESHDAMFRAHRDTLVARGVHYEDVFSAKSLRDIDERFSAKVHGFGSVHE